MPARTFINVDLPGPVGPDHRSDRTGRRDDVDAGENVPVDVPGVQTADLQGGRGVLRPRPGGCGGGCYGAAVLALVVTLTLTVLRERPATGPVRRTAASPQR